MPRSSLFILCIAAFSAACHAGVANIPSDGTQDASAPLQAALDTFGIVAMEPGTYLLQSPVHIRSNQGIVGPATFIVGFEGGQPGAKQLDSVSNSAFILSGENTRIEEVEIRKPFVDGSYGIGILGMSGSANIRIHAVEISGYSARYGIHLVEVEDFEISNCYIHDFMMNSDADMIADSPAGIRVTRSRRGVVCNNRIVRIETGPQGEQSISPLVPEYGPQHYQSDNMTIMQCQLVTVSNNTLETSGEGIDMLLSWQCALTGNTVRDSWFQGFKMLGCNSCTMTGNVLVDCYHGIGLADHTAVGSPCRYNTISGNTIRFTDEPGTFGPDRPRDGIPFTKCGIFLDSGCSYNTVVGNTIADDRTVPFITMGIQTNGIPTNTFESNTVWIKGTESEPSAASHLEADLVVEDNDAEAND